MLDSQFLQTVAEILTGIKNGEYDNSILTSLFELQSIRVENDAMEKVSHTFFLFKGDSLDAILDNTGLKAIQKCWSLAWDLNGIDSWANYSYDVYRNELCIVLSGSW